MAGHRRDFAIAPRADCRSRTATRSPSPSRTRASTKYVARLSVIPVPDDRYLAGVRPRPNRLGTDTLTPTDSGLR